MSVTVTLPLSIVNGIDEEALQMGRGFSDATAQIVRIGLDVRRTQRLPERVDPWNPHMADDDGKKVKP